MHGTLKPACKGCGRALPTRKTRGPTHCRDCRETFAKADLTVKNSVAETIVCKPPKTADPQKRSLVRSRGLVATHVPAEVWDAIFTAEVGELGVVRNLRDRPPRELVAKLQAGIKDWRGA
jgi:hypothetical protein